MLTAPAAPRSLPAPGTPGGGGLNVSKGRRRGGDKALGGNHREFYRRLSVEERMLITLRDELYGGAWDVMLEDLKDRLTGKPYIFKLVSRIEEDLQRIEKLRTYETEHQVNLNEYAEEGE